MKIILKDGTEFTVTGQERKVKDIVENDDNFLKVKNGANSYYINLGYVSYVDEEDNK